MDQRIVLLAALLALPLIAQQDSRKPSPFPEKNRGRNSAPEKSQPRQSGSATQTSPNAPAASGPEGPATAAVASPMTGTACFFSTRAAGELVAAHATLPIGTRVKVTNLTNRKTVEVQVVERFQASGRVINVSEAAARQLGFIQAGTAEVQLELVPQPAASSDRQ